MVQKTRMVHSAFAIAATSVAGGRGATIYAAFAELTLFASTCVSLAIIVGTDLTPSITKRSTCTPWKIGTQESRYDPRL